MFAARLPKTGFPVLASLAGNVPEELRSMTNAFGDKVVGFEINFSCPHSDGLGRSVGDDPALVRKITNMVAASGKPAYAKIGIGMHRTADIALESGAAGITVINTIPALVYDACRKPLLGSLECGLSGDAIRLPALRTIHDMRKRHPDAVIMGCDGISTHLHAMDAFRAGANAIQVGTVAIRDIRVFETLAAWHGENHVKILKECPHVWQ